MDGLKPCAFCGGEAEYVETKHKNGRDRYFVRCKSCGKKFEQFFWDGQKVKEIWNTWYREEKP